MKSDIILEGIETNNLKNIDVVLKKNAINLIIGPSGSGKSSLAYDTVAQIGQHEFLSMFADNVSEPTYKVRSFSNMVAAVPIKQTNHNNNLRSTIGTYFGLNRSIGLIYAVSLGVSEDIFVLNKESNLCPECHGLGTVSMLDENRIVDYNVPLEKDPFKCWNRYKDFYSQIIKEFCEDNKINSSKTFRDLTATEKKKILFGESDKKYSIRYKKTNAFSRRTSRFYGVMTGMPMLPNHSIGKQFYAEKPCPCCNGKKYSKELENFKLKSLSIGEFMSLPFEELISVIDSISSENKDARLGFTLGNLKSFVTKANELNLGHLFFNRSIPTLSGGELQRLRMVQVFNTQLTDLIIVLDEPLAGLSGKEKECIYSNVVELSKKHTVLVVDHSEKFVNAASNVIALGTEGGVKGGYLVDWKKYLEQQRNTNPIEVPKIKDTIIVSIQNDVYRYRGVDVEIAKDRLNLITGYSGVGKSTLLREYFPQKFEKYEYINQKSLLGNRNSSVATALDISGKISDVFAKKFSKDKKLFSNLTGNDGMCPVCQGAGFLEYGSDRNMLTRLECCDCEGTGFNKILKKYRVKDKSIFDIWKMTISEGIEYFSQIDKKIALILESADEIMIGHLKIGQATASLSGGENIRIKVLKASKNTAAILGIDEPFKGLNPIEINKMIEYFDRLRQGGKTIVIVDHTEGIDSFFSKTIELENDNGILRGK